MAQDIVISGKQIDSWIDELMKAQEDGELEASYNRKDYEFAIRQAFTMIVGDISTDALDSLFSAHPTLDIHPVHLCDMAGCYWKAEWQDIFCKRHRQEEDARNYEYTAVDELPSDGA